MRARRSRGRAVVAVAIVAMLAIAGCSSGDDADEGAEDESGAAPTTTVAEPEETDPFVRDVVATLASDDLEGRDDGTAASVASQDFLIEQLQAFAEPISGDATDPDAYRQEFANGTNVLAVIPGAELPDEYVVVGAHYDHLGNDCDDVTAEDDICNGATDNAAGVAAALAVGRAIAGADEAPRRSVVLAFWDREEDDFAGSLEFLAEPPVPTEDELAYVNR